MVFLLSVPSTSIIIICVIVSFSGMDAACECNLWEGEVKARERERGGCYGREGATTAVTRLGTWGASVPSKETMDIYEGRVAPSNWGTHLNAV